MLSIMRRHYHNTLNRELAEMLGVSERSVTRKAREMCIRDRNSLLHAGLVDDIAKYTKRAMIIQSRLITCTRKG